MKRKTFKSFRPFIWYLLAGVCFSTAIQAQQTDSLSHDKISSLKSEIDSLKNLVTEIQLELHETRRSVEDDNSEMDSLISMLQVGDVEDMDFASRSKKGRVDALLQAITKYFCTGRA